MRPKKDQPFDETRRTSDEDWGRAIGHFVEKLRANHPSDATEKPPERLLDWAKQFLPHHFVAHPSAMHRWAAKRFDLATKVRGCRINLLAPRGNAKSTLGTLAFPLREALEGREKYIWLLSDTKSQAASHLKNLQRELDENERLRYEYPAALEKVSFRANAIALGNGTVIESYGTGQRLRGRRLRQFRPTLIICDDIQNEEHIVSETQRNRSRTWFHGTLLKAGTVSTNVVHLATALHNDAVAVELLRTPGWTNRVFKSIAQWPDRTDLWTEWEKIAADFENPNASIAARKFYQNRKTDMDAGAKILWPEVESLYDLMKMRLESGEKTFLREKQNSPINPNFCEFDEKSFDESRFFDVWPTATVVKTLALDPSKGKDSGAGDFSAFVFAAIDPEGAFYIDAHIARLPVHEILETAVTLYQQWNPDLFGVEVNQFQELLRDELERRFRSAGILAPPICPITNTVGKIVRVRRLGPLLAAGNVRFRRNSPGVRLLIEQLKAFPVGDHDDGPDALEMAIRLAREMTRPPEIIDPFEFDF